MGQKFDFNNAPEQRSGELIPSGIIAKMIMSIRPGNVGPDGWFTQSKTSDVQMLDAEFTIMGGPYDRRKFWQNMTVSGGTLNDKGQSKGGEITRATLKAMLESSRNIMPADMSDAAMEARRAGFEDFDGIIFIGKVGMEKETNDYPAKNKLALVITPDHKAYQEAIAGTYQQPPAAGSGASPAPWGSENSPQNPQTALANTTGSPWAAPGQNAQTGPPAGSPAGNPWGTSTAPAGSGQAAGKPAGGNVPSWAK